MLKTNFILAATPGMIVMPFNITIHYLLHHSSDAPNNSSGISSAMSIQTESS